MPAGCRSSGRSDGRLVGRTAGRAKLGADLIRSLAPRAAWRARSWTNLGTVLTSHIGSASVLHWYRIWLVLALLPLRSGTRAVLLLGLQAFFFFFQIGPTPGEIGQTLPNPGRRLPKWGRGRSICVEFWPSAHKLGQTQPEWTHIGPNSTDLSPNSANQFRPTCAQNRPFFARDRPTLGRHRLILARRRPNLAKLDPG